KTSFACLEVDLSPPRGWSTPVCGGQASSADVAPAGLAELHAVLLCGVLDPVPRLVPLRVADALDLVEPSDRRADMIGIFDRLLALSRKGEFPPAQLVSILRRQSAHHQFLCQ